MNTSKVKKKQILCLNMKVTFEFYVVILYDIEVLFTE